MDFSEIRTPVFESTELFARGVGADTDIVSKEMYTFEDLDSRSAHPSSGGDGIGGTGLHRAPTPPGPADLEGLLPGAHVPGGNARRRGRFRQFHQLGAEVLGSDHPAIEAEVIELLQLFPGSDWRRGDRSAGELHRLQSLPARVSAETASRAP